jgi:hypothetical protein
MEAAAENTARRSLDASRADIDESRYFVMDALKAATKSIGWDLHTDGADEDGGFCNSAVESRDIVYLRPGTSKILYSRMAQGDTPPVIWRVPGMSEASNKCALAKNLSRLSSISGEAFPFTPQTWNLPEDADALSADDGSGLFIIKPDCGSKGQGIMLCRGGRETADLWQAQPKDPEDKSSGKCVVQRYIEDPMLIDGRKFDCRLYVLVSGVAPALRAHVYNEGLVRMCTVPYAAPTEENFANSKMHLTNIAVNEEFLGDAEDTADCKMLLSEFLASGLVAPTDFWRQIHGLLAPTLAAMQPELALQYDSCFPGLADAGAPSACYQTIGLDVMLDAQGACSLLEVNAHPSFATPTEQDRLIKIPAMAGSLLIVEREILEPREAERARLGESACGTEGECGTEQQAKEQQAGRQAVVQGCAGAGAEAGDNAAVVPPVPPVLPAAAGDVAVGEVSDAVADAVMPPPAAAAPAPPCVEFDSRTRFCAVDLTRYTPTLECVAGAGSAGPPPPAAPAVQQCSGAGVEAARTLRAGAAEASAAASASASAGPSASTNGHATFGRMRCTFQALSAATARGGRKRPGGRGGRSMGAAAASVGQVGQKVLLQALLEHCSSAPAAPAAPAEGDVATGVAEEAAGVFAAGRPSETDLAAAFGRSKLGQPAAGKATVSGLAFGRFVDGVVRCCSAGQGAGGASTAASIEALLASISALLAE